MKIGIKTLVSFILLTIISMAVFAEQYYAKPGVSIQLLNRAPIEINLGESRKIPIEFVVGNSDEITISTSTSSGLTLANSYSNQSMPVVLGRIRFDVDLQALETGRQSLNFFITDQGKTRNLGLSVYVDGYSNWKDKRKNKTTNSQENVIRLPAHETVEALKSGEAESVEPVKVIDG
ncbi:MAG: hypothetical protein ACI93R_003294 [Flavobacteriales bacterium]|jgi:hypothetical protein